MFLSLSIWSLPKHLIIYLYWFNAVRAGELSAAELENLMVIVANPRQFKIPDWFLNRKKDYKDGRYSQVVSNALDMKLRDDLERLKKIRLLFSMLSSMIVLFRHTGFLFVIFSIDFCQLAALLCFSDFRHVIACWQHVLSIIIFYFLIDRIIELVCYSVRVMLMYIPADAGLLSIKMC